MCGITGRSVFLRILNAFRQGRCSKTARARECRVGGVEIHRHAALLISFLFPFQANGKSATHCMTQPLSLKKEKNQGINNSINNQRKAKEETRPETVNPSSLTMATFIIGVIKLVSLSLSLLD